MNQIVIGVYKKDPKEDFVHEYPIDFNQELQTQLNIRDVKDPIQLTFSNIQILQSNIPALKHFDFDKFDFYLENWQI